MNLRNSIILKQYFKECHSKCVWFLMISKEFVEFYLKIIGRYMIEEDNKNN